MSALLANGLNIGGVAQVKSEIAVDLNTLLNSVQWLPNTAGKKRLVMNLAEHIFESNMGDS